MLNDPCYVTRGTFLTLVGAINADIIIVRSGLKISTKYRLVAERVDQLARYARAKSLLTVTDGGLYVVSVKGFGR